MVNGFRKEIEYGRRCSGKVRGDATYIDVWALKYFRLTAGGFGQLLILIGYKASKNGIPDGMLVT